MAPDAFAGIEPLLRHKLVTVTGRISRRGGTLSPILENMKPIDVEAAAVNKMPVTEWR